MVIPDMVTVIFEIRWKDILKRITPYIYILYDIEILVSPIIYLYGLPKLRNSIKHDVRKICCCCCGGNEIHDINCRRNQPQIGNNCTAL